MKKKKPVKEKKATKPIKKTVAKKATKNRSMPAEQSTDVERIVEVVAFIAEVYAVNATHVKRIVETHPELLTLFLISLGDITPGVVHRAERHRRAVNLKFVSSYNKATNSG